MQPTGACATLQHGVRFRYTADRSDSRHPPPAADLHGRPGRSWRCPTGPAYVQPLVRCFKNILSAQYFTPCHAVCPTAVAESIAPQACCRLPKRLFILLLHDGRFYRILAAAAGLDDWTGADSPGIQQLAILPSSARSVQSDIAVIWVPPPDGSPSPYAAAPSELLV